MKEIEHLKIKDQRELFEDCMMTIGKRKMSVSLGKFNYDTNEHGLVP